MKKIIDPAQTDKIIKAFIALMDGHDEQDIYRFTGLQKKQCREIYQLYSELVKD